MHGRYLQCGSGGSSRIGLVFRTRPTAPPQACTLIGAAAMPEIDGDRPHTMVQSRQAPARRPPTSGRVPCVDAGRNWSSKVPCFVSRPGPPLSIKVRRSGLPGFFFRGSCYTLVCCLEKEYPFMQKGATASCLITPDFVLNSVATIVAARRVAYTEKKCRGSSKGSRS